MAFALADRVKFTTATTGTGTITVSAAVAGYVTPAGSGQLADADVVPIFIEGAAGAWEHSLATLGSTQTTLTRVLRKSSTGSLLNLSGTSTVFIDPGAADLGGMALLSHVSAVAATDAIVDTTFDATYSAYRLIGRNIHASVSTNLECRMKIGGSYISTGSYYGHLIKPTFTADTYVGLKNQGNSSMNIISNIRATASDASHFVMDIIGDPTNTASAKAVNWNGFSGENYIPAIGVGVCATVGALTGLKFFGGVGTLTGEFYLYGIKPS